MQFSRLSVFLALVFSSVRAGEIGSLQILKRQLDTCRPVRPPVTCERSCGPGYVQCMSFPNCYNPGRGDSCCSDGKYCPVGSYCTDTTCCPDGASLEECGATTILDVIPPPAPNTDNDDDNDDDDDTVTTSPSPPTPSNTAGESSSPEATSSPAVTDSVSSLITPVPLPVPTDGATTLLSNATFTTSLPAQQTVSAAAGLRSYSSIGAALCGFGLLLTFL